MIVAKPKVGTLFSIGVFITICLAISGYVVGYILGTTTPKWYHYAIVLVLGPLGLGLLFRQLLGYRVIKVGKEKIEVNHPSQFRHQTFKLKDINRWKENTVKTISGTYKEVEIRFTNNKVIRLSMQEHTDYIPLIKYLKKKCSKKMADA